jgi:cell pole-organizing protein PopZ
MTCRVEQNMDSAQEMPSQAQEELAGDVMESVGEPEVAGEDVSQSHEPQGTESNDPLYVQKRLKQQKRAHERELRDMHARIADLQSRVQPQQESYNNQGNNPYEGAQDGSHIDEQIHRAVRYALNHKEMEEGKAKQAQQMAHVQKQYGELSKHLDNTADKYDDFDEVVRGDDSPFTTQMRDAALLLPKKGAGSAGEVLYKLGKNREELHRISKLHPLDQAAEMVRLSHALISGGENKPSNSPRSLGQVKNTPVANSHTVTEKTPIGSIRERMKHGNWK